MRGHLAQQAWLRPQALLRRWEVIAGFSVLVLLLLSSLLFKYNPLLPPSHAAYTPVGPGGPMTWHWGHPLPIAHAHQ